MANVRRLFVFAPVALLFLLVLLVINPPTTAQGAEPGGPNQWQSVGGIPVFSTKHDFINTWTAAGNGMWWKNDEDRSHPARHSSDEVNKEIEVKKGEITVRGPGFLTRFLRRRGNAAVWLKDPETGKPRGTFDLGTADMYKAGGKWTGKWVPGHVFPFYPEKMVRGRAWVPENETVTCEVWASSHISTAPTWSGHGEKGVEGDIWFFPGPTAGGAVIKVTGPNGNEIKIPNDPNDPDDPPGDPDDPPGDPDDPPGNLAERLRVRVEDRQTRPDTSVTVPVWLEFPKTFPRSRNGRVNVANLNVEIHYDPRVVAPGGDIVAGNLMGGAIFQSNTAQSGLIKLGFAKSQGVQTSGIVAQIPFNVIGKPGQRSQLIVQVTTVNDDQDGTPAIVPVHGSIEILQAGVPGDINGNGVVDAGDALCALKMSVDLMKEDLILDMDHQDGVTSNDARLLLKMAAQGGNTVPNTGSGAIGTNSGGGTTGTTTTIPAGGGNTTPPLVTATTAEARRAYQEYIAAYNRMTSLMAKGKGDTPAAETAHKAYVAAKKKYEASLDPPPGKE